MIKETYSKISEKIKFISKFELEWKCSDGTFTVLGKNKSLEHLFNYFKRIA